MNLNEAFRFQNAISNAFDTAGRLLRSDYNITKTVQKHNRQAVNPDAKDEELEVVYEDASKICADDLIKFMVRMVEEKEKLAAAIAVAKGGLNFNFDAECSLNATRRALVDRLRALNAVEPKNRRKRGSDFKFNVAGDQVPYSYTIDETVTVAFDKSVVRETMKSMADKADGISRKIDLAEVNTEVSYEAPFSLNDRFEDIVKDVLSH